jgi:hypothetical protein
MVVRRKAHDLLEVLAAPFAAEQRAQLFYIVLGLLGHHERSQKEPCGERLNRANLVGTSSISIHG